MKFTVDGSGEVFVGSMRVETALHSSFELNVVHELDREALDGGETRVVGRLVEVVCVRVEPNEYHSPQRSANDTQARESINCPLKAAGSEHWPRERASRLQWNADDSEPAEESYLKWFCLICAFILRS